MTRLIKCMICVVACLCALTAVAEADVPIDETTFPDDNFRAYVLERIDKDGDAMLSEGEIEETTDIDVADMGIADLTGIGFFTELISLFCDENELINIEISHCKNLRSLHCSYNRIEKLDISSCTKLNLLQCSNNQISKLELQGCAGLMYLYCVRNNIAELDLSACPKLESLYCDFNCLTELNVRACPELKNLACGNNKLTMLDISDCHELESLYCGSNKIKELDVSKCPDLKELSCVANKLTVLNVSSCSKLYSLYCAANKLTSVNVSNCTKLRTFESTKNIYPIIVPSSRTFNLVKLPGNFDVSRTSNWVGGTVSGNILTVNSGAKQVTYDYDAGNGRKVKFYLNVTVDENMPAYRPGDADNNGAVNSADALTILHYCVSDDVTINTANADINGDGTVSILDALCIFQHEAGWDGVLR